MALVASADINITSSTKQAKDAQSTAASAQSAADSAKNLAQQAANGINTNYYGPDQPTDPKDGDLWFQEDDSGNVLSIQRYDAASGSWIIGYSLSKIQDAQKAADDAAAAAATAQKAADDANAVGAAAQKTADSAASAASSAASAASDAANAASDAKSAAGTAQTTADGKNTNFYGPDDPVNPKAGDAWFKPSGEDDSTVIPMQYDGTQWNSVSDVIAQAAKTLTDAWKSVNGNINGLKIEPLTITDEQIDTGAISEAKMNWNTHLIF
jgi:hypothetical protein